MLRYASGATTVLLLGMTVGCGGSRGEDLFGGSGGAPADASAGAAGSGGAGGAGATGASGGASGSSAAGGTGAATTGGTAGVGEAGGAGAATGGSAGAGGATGGASGASGGAAGAAAGGTSSGGSGGSSGGSAGGGPVEGIACGAATCRRDQGESCCLSDSSGLHCFDEQGGDRCTCTGTLCEALEIPCDGPEDCPAAEVCCLSDGITSNAVACRTSCNNDITVDRDPLCHPTDPAPCPDPQEVCTADSRLEGLFTCNPP